MRWTHRYFLALGLGWLALACGTSHPTDGSTPDAGRTDMRTPSTDGGGRMRCGPTLCVESEVCCNASCGICAAPGETCIDLECVDAGPCMPPPCPAPPDGCRYVGGGCDSCGELICESCGGFGGMSCGDDSYCDYPAGCGFDDGSGRCEPRPEGCPEDCPGVCGCDGMDYCNACMAAAAGVDVLRDGTCEGPPPRGDCGGFAGLTCRRDEWCDYGGCPGPDQLGSCQTRPDACPDIYDPVCGCNGETYGNRCQAAAAGMNVASPGECGA